MHNKLNLAQKIMTLLGTFAFAGFPRSFINDRSPVPAAGNKRRGKKRKFSYGANLQHHFDSNRPELPYRQQRHQQYLRDQAARKAVRQVVTA